MMFFRFAQSAVALCLVAWTSLAGAQTSPAPAKSAEAQQAESVVREQVKKFYDLLMAGKPRAAEALVCEASKDEYYSMVKPSPRSVEVRAVKAADDLKTAQVTLVMEDEVSFGVQKKVVKFPVPTEWRLESGQWCYFLPPAGHDMVTPFGTVKSSRGVDGAPPKAPPAPQPLEKLSMEVSFSKPALQLPSKGEGKDEIEVSNGLNGPIQFQLACPSVPGLQCKMGQDYIAAGKKGKLLVEFKYQGTAIDGQQAVTLWIMPFRSEHKFPILPVEAAPKP